MLKNKRTYFGYILSILLCLSSCGKSPTKKNNEFVQSAGTSKDNDMDIYEQELEEFSRLYDIAKNETSDSKRYVLMANAEAELLSSSVFLPTSTQGGNFALSKVAPRTAPYALWGTNEYRYKNLVVTNEIIKNKDREALLNIWKEKKGQDETYDTTEYAKKYLKESGYTLQNKYVHQYVEGAKTFDYLSTSMTADTEVLVNIVDGLLEYNGQNQLIPALAEELPIKTKDEKGNAKYTFKIRQGLYWVQNDGTKTLYPVTAHDFVTGFQHMLDAEGGLEYLVQGVIQGADEYLTGRTTDFTTVGVKAKDDYTLEYELVGDPSYFLTYLSYNIYQPLNKSYYESKGGALGKDAFMNASKSNGYTYGTSKDNVLSCGAYYISSYADQSEVTFKKNPYYWDNDIEIEEIKWLYNDSKNQLTGYNWFKNSQISSVGLNATAIAEAKKDNLFNDYAFVSDTTATTYLLSYNLNRQTYILANGGVETKQTKENVKDTHKALNNRNFRLALSYAFDKSNWNGQVVGEDLKNNALRNSFVPYSFVSLLEDVDVKINNERKTYPAGTQYGEILQDYCNALGLKVDLRDSVNGWYQPEESKRIMELAREELLQEGLDISKNKIHLDVFYYSGSKTQTNQANSYKNSIENILGSYVQVDLVPATTLDDYQSSGYRAANGAAGNYDIFYGSGWGPDYGDPSTYLDSFLSEGRGYMTKIIGLW